MAAMLVVASAVLAGCAEPAPLDPLTECVNWTWDGDLRALAEQIAEQARADGVEIGDVTVSGSLGFASTASGGFGVVANSVFRYLATIDGVEVPLSQEFTGEWSGRWSWADTPDATVGKAELTLDDGAAIGVVTLPASGAGAEEARNLAVPFQSDAPLQFTCDDSGLTIQQDGDPLVTRWSRL
ncbi:MAG: hypothetical protein DI534_02940 [Leifsonia xyli]|nr:MAG: hypothetical protein DI534_02940 [Leifsonia xyli]